MVKWYLPQSSLTRKTSREWMQMDHGRKWTQMNAKGITLVTVRVNGINYDKIATLVPSSRQSPNNKLPLQVHRLSLSSPLCPLCPWWWSFF